MHYEIDNLDYTWRSYAGDTHAFPVWQAHGAHYWFDPYMGMTVFLGLTFATTCNITQW